jgi:hypothetical protein
MAGAKNRTLQRLNSIERDVNNAKTRMVCHENLLYRISMQLNNAAFNGIFTQSDNRFSFSF